MSYQLYRENTEKRKLHHQAREELKELKKELKDEIRKKALNNRNDFDAIYASGRYDELRDLAYHFEYIGHLVKNRRVHFDLIFDPITFPDWLMDDSAELRKDARVFVTDFWDGIEYLYKRYSEARAIAYKDRLNKAAFNNCWEKKAFYIKLHLNVLLMRLTLTLNEKGLDKRLAELRAVIQDGRENSLEEQKGILKKYVEYRYLKFKRKRFKARTRKAGPTMEAVWRAMKSDVRKK